jgi:hypothetical protein
VFGCVGGGELKSGDAFKLPRDSHCGSIQNIILLQKQTVEKHICCSFCVEVGALSSSVCLRVVVGGRLPIQLDAAGTSHRMIQDD